MFSFHTFKFFVTWILTLSSTTKFISEIFYFSEFFAIHNFAVHTHITVWKNDETHTAKCGNCGNLLGHFFEKNFVKVTFLLKKILQSWFDEIFLGDSKFFIFPHCTVHWQKNTRQINYFVISIVKTLLSRNFWQKNVWERTSAYSVEKTRNSLPRNFFPSNQSI